MPKLVDRPEYTDAQLRAQLAAALTAAQQQVAGLRGTLEAVRQEVVSWVEAHAEAMLQNNTLVALVRELRGYVEDERDSEEAEAEEMRDWPLRQQRHLLAVKERDGLLARIDAALVPPATTGAGEPPDPARCNHDVRCAHCGTRWPAPGVYQKAGTDA